MEGLTTPADLADTVMRAVLLARLERPMAALFPTTERIFLRNTAGRRVVWLGHGGYLEKTVVRSELVELPLHYMGKLTVAAEGTVDLDIAPTVLAVHLAEAFLDLVQRCAREAGYPDGKLPEEGMAVMRKRTAVEYRAVRPGELAERDSRRDWTRCLVRAGVSIGIPAP